jgi:succinate-semialdehyde dehydrogenase/glutarate-semialdehyde dehydrogenase
MKIAQSEIFGPIAPVIRFTDEAEAIRIANDTPFGLAAYFYARDLGRVWRVMAGLEYGMVAVNEGVLSTETAPFGGIKRPQPSGDSVCVPRCFVAQSRCEGSAFCADPAS